MCLAVPMKLIKIEGEMGLVEVGNVRSEVGLQLVEGVKAGDYLIVHAGFCHPETG